MEEKKLTAREDKASATNKYKRFIFGRAGDDCNGAVYLSKENDMLEQVIIVFPKED